MSDINFEKDQEEVLDRTENIKSLADQVKKLRDLEDEVKDCNNIVSFGDNSPKCIPNNCFYVEIKT
jgi:hypothetical protein